MGRNASSSPGPDKERTVRCQNTGILQPRPRSDQKTILQCDASQLGLRACYYWSTKMAQKDAMCSRSLVDAEPRYSNIERECLAVKFGLQKFEYYLLGRHTIIESDDSPLEQVFRKNIAETPSRLQKDDSLVFRIRQYSGLLARHKNTCGRCIIQSLSTRKCHRRITTMWSKLRHRNRKSNWCTSHKIPDQSWQHT